MLAALVSGANYPREKTPHPVILRPETRVDRVGLLGRSVTGKCGGRTPGRIDAVDRRLGVCDDASADCLSTTAAPIPDLACSRTVALRRAARWPWGTTCMWRAARRRRLTRQPRGPVPRERTPAISRRWRASDGSPAPGGTSRSIRCASTLVRPRRSLGRLGVCGPGDDCATTVKCACVLGRRKACLCTWVRGSEPYVFFSNRFLIRFGPLEW